MSSSQGGRVQIGAETTSGVITRGYAYDTDVVRDASDWTRQLKEQTLFRRYNSNNVVKDMEPVYMKFGNDIRLTYLNGKFKSITCQGGAFIEAGIPTVQSVTSPTCL